MNDAPNPDGRSAPVRCRRLAAWFPADDDERPADGPGSSDWTSRAAAELARRPASPDQTGVVAALPEELSDHVEQLERFPDARRMFDDKWTVALVTDLRRLVSAQASVRVGDIDGNVGLHGDLRAVAHLTLPVQRPPARIPADFDPALQVWKITSQNPNMRITNQVGSELRNGVFVFGFVVEVLTSFLSVAEHRGRLILRDGYHRAYRLIDSGVLTAPAFVRAYADDEPVFTGTMLPQAIWTGDRPPLLGDFTNDTVAHDVWLPETDTTLYVGAIPPSLSLDPRANR